MSLPATDPKRTSASSGWSEFRAALHWGLACALCVGCVWNIALSITFSLMDVGPIHIRESDIRTAVDPLGMTVCGAVAGLIAGVLVAVVRNRAGVWKIVPVGVLAGIVGGGLSIPTIRLCNSWIHPIISSSLLWAVVGLFAGFAARRVADEKDTFSVRKPRFEFLNALWWALAGAFCAGGVWFVALVVLRSIWGISPISPDPADDVAWLSIIYAAVGAGYGLIVGALVGLVRGGGQRVTSVLVLSVGGLLFGALGNGLSVIVAAMTAPGVHPIASYSLVWEAVGGWMGLYGYLWSCWITAPVELRDEAEETLPADRTIQWLLRERKRRWRELPVVRVSPVFVVSASSLIGAAIAAPSELSLGLLTLSALGLSVAWVLYNQETRLRSLERRLRGRE